MSFTSWLAVDIMRCSSFDEGKLMLINFMKSFVLENRTKKTNIHTCCIESWQAKYKIIQKSNFQIVVASGINNVF